MARHNTVKAAVSRIQRIRTLRDEKREVTGLIDETQLEAIGLLDDLGQSSISYEDDGMTHKGTVVRGTTLEINPLKLKKKLGAKRYNRLTTASLDMGKLESAIAAGDVDPKDVSACSSEKDKKPYIKITASKSRL